MKPLSLSPSEQSVLDRLKHLHYATEDQLVYWTHCHRSTVSRALSGLRDLRFVQVEKSLTPNIWHLTRKAARFLETPLPSGNRRSSGPVMTHTVHRNQCEILLRKDFRDFRFLNRPELYRLGLNPSHGEHAGLHAGKLFFLLLDDYLMGSDRIGQAVSRRHTAREKYCDRKISLNWSMVFKQFFVASTHQKQIGKHRRWMTRRGIEAQLLYMPPVWAF